MHQILDNESTFVMILLKHVFSGFMNFSIFFPIFFRMALIRKLTLHSVQAGKQEWDILHAESSRGPKGVKTDVASPREEGSKQVIQYLRPESQSVI